MTVNITILVMFEALTIEWLRGVAGRAFRRRLSRLLVRAALPLSMLGAGYFGTYLALVGAPAGVAQVLMLTVANAIPAFYGLTAAAALSQLLAITTAATTIVVTWPRWKMRAYADWRLLGAALQSETAHKPRLAAWSGPSPFALAPAVAG